MTHRTVGVQPFHNRIFAQSDDFLHRPFFTNNFMDLPLLSQVLRSELVFIVAIPHT